MATFNIPDIGTEITLAEDWKFNLFKEQRNNSLFERKNIKMDRTITIILPKGTVLRVDRIFIRQNMSDYSSLSFYIISSPDTDLNPTIPVPKENISSFSVGKIVRFWAKLDEVNKIEF